MYLTVKQELKHLSKTEYLILRELSYTAKNLNNEALYNIRQHFFDEGTYLNYESNYRLLKESPHYKTLNSNVAQQILKEVDGQFKSFFGLLKLAKEGKYKYKDIHIPHYLPKDGFATLIIGFVRINGNRLTIPYSNSYKKTHKPIEITIPPNIVDKEVKEIRIIPKCNARFFEVQYTYKVDCISRNLNIDNALALDLGIDNLITAVSSTGKSFIIDGRRLKSINQWYNKENSRLQGIKDKQKYGKRITKRQSLAVYKHNNKVNDYLSKAARIVINYCNNNDIGTLVAGYNKDFQSKAAIGKVSNQNFVNIPFSKLLNKLEYLCKLNGIRFIKQEESYTSKADFWSKDYIPIYDPDNDSRYRFSGKRIYRGLYKSQTGITLNADVNGALNILRKSSVVDLSVLYSRGDVDTPIRIRVA